MTVPGTLSTVPTVAKVTPGTCVSHGVLLVSHCTRCSRGTGLHLSGARCPLMCLEVPVRAERAHVKAPRRGDRSLPGCESSLCSLFWAGASWGPSQLVWGQPGAGPGSTLVLGGPGPLWGTASDAWLSVFLDSPSCNTSLSGDSRPWHIDGGVPIEHVSSCLLPLKTSLCDDQGGERSETLRGEEAGTWGAGCPWTPRSDAVDECH